MINKEIIEKYKISDKDIDKLNYSNHYTSIPTIGTKNLGITLYEKCASSNLEHFFEPMGLKKEQQLVKDIDKHRILVIVTRSEYDRWCGGVAQDIDDKIRFEEVRLPKIRDHIMKGLNDVNSFNEVFMSQHSHMGRKLWFSQTQQLISRRSAEDTTFFIDIDTLNDKKFWKWICEQDPTWPNYKDWFPEWVRTRSTYPPHHLNRPITEWIRYMLEHDERLSIIAKTLNDNQSIIDGLFKSPYWLHEYDKVRTRSADGVHEYDYRDESEILEQPLKDEE
jgi:hypothetical protein